MVSALAPVAMTEKTSPASPASPLRRIWLALTAVFVLVGGNLFLASPQSASADIFATCVLSTGTGCLADDANEDFCTVYAWPTTYGNRFMDAMANLDAQTDMYDTYQSTCGAQTDIGGYLNKSKEMTAPLDSYTLGAYSCTKKIAGSSTVCDQGSLTINTSLLTDATKIRKTLCHEIGHAVGLLHYPMGTTGVGCMVSWYSSAITYSAHHVSHINAAY